MSPKRPRWKKRVESHVPGSPWSIHVTWANRAGHLVATKLEIEERPGSPDQGITMSDLRKLALDERRRDFLSFLRSAASYTELTPEHYKDAGLEPPAPGLVLPQPEGWKEAATGALSTVSHSGPKTRRSRITDKYLQELVAEWRERLAKNDPHPNKTIAARRGVRPEEIRNHLHAATKRGLIPKRSTTNVPIEVPDELPEGK